MHVCVCVCDGERVRVSIRVFGLAAASLLHGSQTGQQSRGPEFALPGFKFTRLLEGLY